MKRRKRDAHEMPGKMAGISDPWEFNLECQLVSVMIEVLSALVVEVEDAHCVPEVGIP